MISFRSHFSSVFQMRPHRMKLFIYNKDCAVWVPNWLLCVIGSTSKAKAKVSRQLVRPISNKPLPFCRTFHPINFRIHLLQRLQQLSTNHLSVHLRHTRVTNPFLCHLISILEIILLQVITWKLSFWYCSCNFKRFIVLIVSILMYVLRYSYTYNNLHTKLHCN